MNAGRYSGSAHVPRSKSTALFCQSVELAVTIHPLVTTNGGPKVLRLIRACQKPLILALIPVSITQPFCEWPVSRDENRHRINGEVNSWERMCDERVFWKRASSKAKSKVVQREREAVTPTASR